MGRTRFLWLLKVCVPNHEPKRSLSAIRGNPPISPSTHIPIHQSTNPPIHQSSAMPQSRTKWESVGPLNPNSEVGNEIEQPCREPIVGRARHSVRAAPATSACKISPASPSRPAADQDVARVSRTHFGVRGEITLLAVRAPSCDGRILSCALARRG